MTDFDLSSVPWAVEAAARVLEEHEYLSETGCSCGWRRPSLDWFAAWIEHVTPLLLVAFLSAQGPCPECGGDGGGTEEDGTPNPWVNCPDPPRGCGGSGRGPSLADRLADCTGRETNG